VNGSGFFARSYQDHRKRDIGIERAIGNLLSFSNWVALKELYGVCHNSLPEEQLNPILTGVIGVLAFFAVCYFVLWMVGFIVKGRTSE